MRLVFQRVSRASVTVDAGPGSPHAESIGRGAVVLIGFEVGDGEAEADWAADKVARLRVFPDEMGKMNRSLLDLSPPGEALVVSQFTLLADAERGNRPSFVRAAAPASAEPLVRRFADRLQTAHGLTVRRGVFGADMRVELVNRGPVTIVLDRAPPAARGGHGVD